MSLSKTLYPLLSIGGGGWRVHKPQIAPEPIDLNMRFCTSDNGFK